MSAGAKPMLMADLPGKVYLCRDEHPAFKTRPIDPNSTSQKLARLGLGHDIVIPKTSAGMVSRIATKNGIKFTSVTIDGGTNLRVKRIK